MKLICNEKVDAKIKSVVDFINKENELMEINSINMRAIDCVIDDYKNDDYSNFDFHTFLDKFVEYGAIGDVKNMGLNNMPSLYAKAKKEASKYDLELSQKAIIKELQVLARKLVTKKNTNELENLSCGKYEEFKDIWETIVVPMRNIEEAKKGIFEIGFKDCITMMDVYDLIQKVCNPTTTELLEKIEELENRIDELIDRIDELNES